MHSLITPAGYNKGWWDPGAKYHVPANYSYTRYFLASILQFQFHRELVEDRRLHDAAASLFDLRQQGGRRLDAMLKMGQSRPWPDALEALTGSRQMDATAIVDYFAPLDVARRADEGEADGVVGLQGPKVSSPKP